MKLRATLAALALMSLAAAAAPSDPYTGVWNLNLAKSGVDVRSQVLTISVIGDVETYRSELVLHDGSRQETNYTAAYDGQEHPSRTTVTDPNGAVVQRDDTVILVRIDEATRERQWKREGHVIRILRRVLSRDGETLTSHVIDVDEAGNEHPGATLIFDKADSSR